MHRRTTLIALTSLIALAVAASPTVAATPTLGAPAVAPPGISASAIAAAATDITVDAAERAVVASMNSYRQKAGVRPLVIDSRLMALARSRSQTMASSGTFAHLTTTAMASALAARGIAWTMWGENIHWNTATTLSASATMCSTGWYDSLPHRENMLRTAFNYVGVGQVRASNGRHYWTAVFIQGPDRTAPVARLTSATMSSAVRGVRRVALAWTGSDVLLSWGTSGLRSYDVGRSIDGGYTSVLLSATTRTSNTGLTTWPWNLAVGHTYRYVVRARDAAGNLGAWSPAVTLRP